MANGYCYNKLLDSLCSKMITLSSFLNNSFIISVSGDMGSGFPSEPLLIELDDNLRTPVRSPCYKTNCRGD
jgi:hypothetical protein